jgi:hypothetical protein
MYITSINQMRGVEWAKNFLWDMMIVGAPAPFDSWFPATEVTEPLASLASHQFTHHIQEFAVPKNTTMSQMSITFLDSYNYKLAQFMSDWYASILGDYTGLQCLTDAVKEIHIQKLSYRRNVLSHHQYWCYPDGAFNLQLSSSPGPLTHQITLNVAGSNQIVKPA